MVADEAFLLVAEMHRIHPNQSDFRKAEVMALANKLLLVGEIREGLSIHLSSHAVANRPPQPGNHRMLFSPEHGRIRLLQPGDEVHRGRTGRQFPGEDNLDQWGRDIVLWAKARYASLEAQSKPQMSLMDFAGCLNGVYGDVDAYVAELREGWDDRP